jgi:hypothetical protein
MPAVFDGGTMRKETPASSQAVFRRSVFLSLLTASYLQYYFFDVFAQIDSLPKVVVFVAGKTAG